MSYSLKDLDAEEVLWLQRLADGRVHVLPTAMAERLHSLGLDSRILPRLRITAPGSTKTE